jgi:uncharacterized protein (TIGR03663 family)
VSCRERSAWGVLLAAALLLRVVGLEWRPPHHDEAIHAHFADAVLTRTEYRYDPTYHGPLLFYLTAVIFAAGGQSLTTARLYPALAGVALVALPLLLRRRLGGRTAFWCGLLLAVSPTFVYYSRFARNDVPVALFTAAALVLLLRRTAGGWRRLPWVGVLAALHAISKETFYVTVPLLAGAGGAAALAGGVRGPLRRGWSFIRRHAAPLTAALLWFASVTITAYTFGFIHPEDAAFPLRAVQYWYEQHRIQRVAGPWFYYLPRLILYEMAIVGPALVWAVRRRGRLRGIEAFCLAWGLGSIAAYAFLGEKTPWLLTHQVLPFVPLAGFQLARTFSPRGRAWSRALAGSLLAAAAWSTAAVTFRYPAMTTADPHGELLVYVQTTPETGELARRGVLLAEKAGSPLVAAVAGEATWPLWWQWRRLPVRWGLPEAGTRPAIVVCNPEDEAAAAAALGPDYSARRVPLRAWWVEEWRGVGPREIALWFVTRRAWSPIGASDMVVFERAPAREAGPGQAPAPRPGL